MALLGPPPASALLMGYAPAGLRTNGPVMIRGDTETFADYYARRNDGATGAPAAVAAPSVPPAGSEVAQEVRGMLAAAREAHNIPAEYAHMLDGFFECYMREVA